MTEMYQSSSNFTSVKSPLFSIKLPFKKEKRGFFKKMLESGIEKSLGFRELNKIYQSTENSTDPIDFIDKILAYLNVSIDLPKEDLDRIPKKGTLVVMANHPFGGIEGLILAKILKQVRPDVKIMANDLLHSIPELREVFFFVDPFGNKESIRKNLSGLRNVKSWLSDEHVLGVFPSGEVASFNKKTRKIDEPAWNANTAKMAYSSKSTILPVYFDGNNSLAFHLAGLIHPRLRTALLGHQFINKKDHAIKVSIGNPIRFKEYKHMTKPEHLISYAESRTFMLRKKEKKDKYSKKAEYKTHLVKAIKPEIMESELVQLSEQNHLVNSGKFDVFIAMDAQIPNIMREIGRLRELSFRLVGEGSGKETDVDHYDHYYQHLFIWDNEERKVVGAYRLAMIDSITSIFGKKGLYTNSLFKLEQNFLDKVFPGIELGRSFVNPDYQKSFQPLLLLWRGISTYVYRNPNYRYLLGAVSMSKDYSEISKQLIMSYLKQHHWNEQLASFVTARNPYKAKKESVASRVDGIMPYLSLDQVNTMIKEIDPEMGGVPILIKQYLKMGGQLAAFNVDTDFSDVVDGMIIVDLLKSEPESLARYMGDKEYEEYIAYNKVTLPNNLDLVS